MRVQSAFALSHFVSQSRFVSGLTKMKTSCPRIGGKELKSRSVKKCKKGCGENYLQSDCLPNVLGLSGER